MYYQTGKVKLDILTLDHFLRLYPADIVDHRGDPALEISRADLPAQTRITIMPHTR